MAFWTNDYKDFQQTVRESIMPEQQYRLNVYISPGEQVKGTKEVERCTEHRILTDGEEGKRLVAWYMQRGLRFDSEGELRQHQEEIQNDTLEMLATEAVKKGLKMEHVGDRISFVDDRAEGLPE